MCVCLVCFIFKNSIKVLCSSLSSQLPQWVVHRWRVNSLVPFVFCLFWFFEAALRKPPCKTEIFLNYLAAAVRKKHLGHRRNLRKCLVVFISFFSLFFVCCMPEDICVLVLSVKNLLPTAVSKRPFMNNLEVLEKLPPLPGVNAESSTAALIPSHLFTVYSGVFTCCNGMGSS